MTLLFTRKQKEQFVRQMLPHARNNAILARILWRQIFKLKNPVQKELAQELYRLRSTSTNPPRVIHLSEGNDE